MFGWLKRLHGSAAFASNSSVAVVRWKWAFIEASGRSGARHYDPVFWDEVVRRFCVQWRRGEPASRDPARLLEKRLGVYLSFLKDTVLREAQGSALTPSELEQVGEFIARASVHDLHDAILTQPAAVSPVFDMLPIVWLETAGVTRELFEQCYFQSTGKHRTSRQGWKRQDEETKETADTMLRHIAQLSEQEQEDVVKQAAEKILEYGVLLNEQEREQSTQDFKQHMEGAMRDYAGEEGPVHRGFQGAPPPHGPTGQQRLPSESLYIHLNGEPKGPFTVEQLKALLVVETVTNDTPCCHEGAEAWQTVGAYVA